jgi:TonB family protein
MRALLSGGLVALGCAGAASQPAKLAPQGLSQGEIQEVVQSKMKVIEGCAVIAEATGGSLVVEFEVAPSGAVDRVSITDSTVNNDALESCLVKTFQRMKFPSAEVSTRSEFPFRLRAK